MEKQEIKWAKVAPYYQGKVKVLTNDGIEFTPVFFWQSGMAWDGDRRQEPAGKYKPILRDDKTEAEETEIRRMETSEETIMRLKYGVMSPKVLAKHIEMGIDVFGLIASGQAIRKEA